MRSMKPSSVSFFLNDATWARATSFPSRSPSSTSSTPTYQASCRELSFVQVRDRCALAQSGEPFLSARHVQPAWTDPRGIQHSAIEKVLDQRDMVQRELADEQDVEADALLEGVEKARDPAEVDRVLHRTAPDDDPDGDGPGGPRGDPIPGTKGFEDRQETRAVEHLGDRDDPP